MTDGSLLGGLCGFIFDLDGTIYRGNELLPGARSFIAMLRRRGIPHIFLTNNSTTPRDAVARRLVAMGVEASPEEVLTSSDATAAALASEMPGIRVFVIGEEGVRTALTSRGFELTEDYRRADAVVVGMDRRLTYARLSEAALAVRRGALLIATNTDRTLPTEFGLIPGAGSLVAALEVATDVRARVIGKPEPGVFRQAVACMGTAPACTASVGDRPETDITGGQRAGLRTIAVLSGAGTAAAFAALDPPPDWVFADLAALEAAYAKE